MTNQEKFKTPEERIAAFDAWCNRQSRKVGVGCGSCPIRGRGEIYRECLAYWLALEAEEEKPMPCPFCGSPCAVVIRNEDIAVACSECNYQFGNAMDRDATISAHNRVCRAVQAANESEETK